MILLKTMLCSGVYYLERGVADPVTWARMMRLEFGAAVEPHLPELRQDALAVMYRKAGPKPDRRNCWEYRQCGIGGSPSPERGSCPASSECRLDGVHGGQNAGRCCWVIEGTRCDGRVQGSREEKRRCCGECRFMEAVRREEGLHLLLDDEHLSQILSGPGAPGE